MAQGAWDTKLHMRDQHPLLKECSTKYTGFKYHGGSLDNGVLILGSHCISKTSKPSAAEAVSTRSARARQLQLSFRSVQRNRGTYLRSSMPRQKNINFKGQNHKQISAPAATPSLAVDPKTRHPLQNEAASLEPTNPTPCDP